MRALALGLLAGTAWLQWQPVLPGLIFCGGLSGAALLFIALARGSRYFRPTAWWLLGVAIGVSGSTWQASQRLSQSLAESLEGRDLRVTGIIVGLPDTMARGVRFPFLIEHAHTPGGAAVRLPAKVALAWYSPSAMSQPELRAGERWQFTVRLRRPHAQLNPEGFDYEAWLLTEGVRATGYVRAPEAIRLDAFVATPMTLVHRARGFLRERILAALPGERYASVLIALVVGDQRVVSQSDWDIFNRTGIGHLVSISGLHITMIAALFAGLVRWCWQRSFFTRAQLPLWLPTQKAATVAGVFAALLYVALAGFGIPAQRTLLMLSVVAVALWTHRIAAVSQVLCAALAVVLLIDPWAVLWPGFWLSFAAIACILFASTGRALDQQEEGAPDAALSTRMRNACRAATRTQIAVTLGLVPLTMMLFGQVSLIGPLANAIAIPVVSFFVTPLALAGSIAPAPLHEVVLQLAHTAMSWLASALSWLSALPWAVWAAPKPSGVAALLALVGALWLLAPRGWPLRWAGALLWMPVLLAPAAFPEQGARITAFDIGQGNAVLIETASHRLLYDTGPAYSPESDGGSRVLLPYLRARGIQALDALVISHSDLDHAGGAQTLLDQVPVDWVSSSLDPDHPLLGRLVRHLPCRSGQRWAWDGVLFEMLHPDERHAQHHHPNARSCTLRIVYRGQAVLLAGDIEAAQERSLIERQPDKLPADVLLAPHHGSGTSSTTAFLDAVSPSVAVFQVGYRNRYRHPKEEVLERYRRRGVSILRTDHAGAITVELGDETLRFVQERCRQRRYWHTRRCP